MDIIQIILLAGSVAAAITSICLVAKWIIKVLKKVYDFIHTLEKNVNKLLRHDDEQYMAILRLTITADHMPISERLIAGKDYVERGGNGEVKAMYNKLKEECEHNKKN